MPRRLSVLLAALLASATACASGGGPEVRFTVGDATATARPAQYCDDAFTDCRADQSAPVELPVPSGATIRIEVGAEIARSPWQVVFAYRDGAGEQLSDRTRVFPPGEVTEHLLELPAQARLITAQVQQYGPPPEADPGTGEILFPIRGSWVLVPGGA
ncbi:MAG TPA: DUF2771 family protein [Pseudonocardia sp.]|nr:DUF2771 family protein [Pseudonocardia sp.]